MYEDRPTWAARAGNCTAHLFLAYPQEETGTWKMKNQDENHKGMLGTGWEERFTVLKNLEGVGTVGAFWCGEVQERARKIDW